VPFAHYLVLSFTPLFASGVEKSHSDLTLALMRVRDSRFKAMYHDPSIECESFRGIQSTLRRIRLLCRIRALRGPHGRKRRSKTGQVRGNLERAQFPSSLAEIVSETVRIWRKYDLGYDQIKYVMEQARRRLKLRPLVARRRSVERLDQSEIER
jgi:hypothetical protein